MSGILGQNPYQIIHPIPKLTKTINRPYIPLQYVKTSTRILFGVDKPRNPVPLQLCEDIICSDSGLLEYEKPNLELIQLHFEIQ